MKLSKNCCLLLMIIAACEAVPIGATDKKEPHIGYLYPAGGQQGSTFDITAGGQYLQGADSVYISGEGVHATVITVCQAAQSKTAYRKCECI